jgi:hypothetical protein
VSSGAAQKMAKIGKVAHKQLEKKQQFIPESSRLSAWIIVHKFTNVVR